MQIMGNLRNIIDVILVTEKKDSFKWKSNPSYICQKNFDNDLLAISKSKVTLKLNKPL